MRRFVILVFLSLSFCLGTGIRQFSTLYDERLGGGVSAG